MIADVAPDLSVVLLDIEGTTTPMAFVHETLFGFARAHLDQFLEENWSSASLQDVVRRLAREHHADRDAAPPWSDELPDQLRQSVAAYLRWLMDRDRKSPGLKEIQGLIWENGYRAGELHGVVWDDVPRAMTRWRQAGLRLAIYSSGSELAQRRLFQSTAFGDLTPLISAFFDTGVGAKTAPESYGRIAEALDAQPHQIGFVSDVTAELRAARTAGCVAILSKRQGNAPQPDADDFPQISSFDEL